MSPTNTPSTTDTTAVPAMDQNANQAQHAEAPSGEVILDEIEFRWPVVAVRIQERHYEGLKIEPVAEAAMVDLLRKRGVPMADGSGAARPEWEFVGEVTAEPPSRPYDTVVGKVNARLRAVDPTSGRVLAEYNQCVRCTSDSEEEAARLSIKSAVERVVEQAFPWCVKLLAPREIAMRVEAVSAMPMRWPAIRFVLRAR